MTSQAWESLTNPVTHLKPYSHLQHLSWTLHPCFDTFAHEGLTTSYKNPSSYVYSSNFLGLRSIPPGGPIC